MAQKKFSFLSRIIIDSVMLLVFLVCFGMRFTEETLHQSLGIVALLLVFFHLYAGRMWFFSLIKKKKASNAAAMLCLLLVISMALLFGTGLFLFATQDAGLHVRKLHTVSAYWTLVLSGLHTGLYGKKIYAFLGKKQGYGTRIFSPVVLCILSLYGLWVCFELPLFDKLLYGVSFDFWPEERPIILFFLGRLGIFCFFGTIFYAVLSKKKQWIKHFYAWL